MNALDSALLSGCHECAVFRHPAERSVLLEAEAFGGQLLADVDGRLELRVDFAAVADRRRVEGVHRVVDRVVVVEHRLLIRRQLLALAVAARLGVAGTRLDRGPASGMVQAEMPRARAAHREAAQDDSPGIDVVALLHRRERLEQVRFAGPPVRDVRAPERLELDVVLIRRRWLGALLLHDEGDLVQRAVGPVLPDVQPHRLRPVVRLGDRQRVRLHAAVDGRHVRAHDVALSLGPRGRARVELARPRQPFADDRLRVADERFVRKLLGKAQDELGGLAIHVGVGDEGGIDPLCVQRADAVGQLTQPGLNPLPIALGERPRRCLVCAR
jgi:hypothetical protein